MLSRIRLTGKNGKVTWTVGGKEFKIVGDEFTLEAMDCPICGAFKTAVKVEGEVEVFVNGNKTNVNFPSDAFHCLSCKADIDEK